MGQLLVRNLDDDVIERLKQRAERANVSLEQTLRDILTEAVQLSRADIIEEARRIRASIGRLSGSSADLIREDRDNDAPCR